MARAESKPTSLPVSPSPMAAPELPRNLHPGDGSVEDRVTRILDLIRPAVQADGGDLELVDISPEGVVQIRLHGACIGCPSAAVTLKTGIERNLKEHVPEIVRVESID